MILPELPDFTSAIEGFGYIGIFAALIIETGFLIGIVLPLPTESLMIAAGALSATGRFELPFVIITALTAVIAGDNIAYATGHKFGPHLKKRSSSSSRFLKPEHIEKAEVFFEKHGGKSIILARFVPTIRILAPIMAGASKMQYKEFLVYNISGGVFWVGLFVGIGYLFGQHVPNVERYILPGLILVVAGGAIGGAISAAIHRFIKQRRQSR